MKSIDADIYLRDVMVDVQPGNCILMDWAHRKTQNLPSWYFVWEIIKGSSNRPIAKTSRVQCGQTISSLQDIVDRMVKRGWRVIDPPSGIPHTTRSEVVGQRWLTKQTLKGNALIRLSYYDDVSRTVKLYVYIPS